MKKLLPCFLLIFALFGCDKSSGPIKPEDMEPGHIHFASNLIIEDIIRKGENSICHQLSPSDILNPYTMLYTDNVINDFRRNFSTAEDLYHRIRKTGTVISGKIAEVDNDNKEVIFTMEKPEEKIPFTGILRLSLDKKFYEDREMPVYVSGQTATFMCTEYRPVHEFKNDKQHKTEIRLIQCKTADDYYAYFQEKIKERLTDIFHGRETVNPELAKKLASLYLAGKMLPEDSVCLNGSFLACHENLINEISKTESEIKVEHIGSMKMDPEKQTSRKFEQIKSAPAVRPEHPNRSPSGEVIYEQHESVKKQKEAISQIKNPPR